ncbi:Inhibitor of sigma-G Gin [Salinibacillus kushneri]|uniref:Inhibitor of sigma-G Gin n=1 Tax=Salinibacillus kushneri TaxID=237682 RepID=A0A1I0JAP2_9BACI|nr:sigma factor G inhibitor Gin [Salinibacillus kushneri]SEU07048.1 Inhibitor of sigma-G Gin [Salinibacillus kushneri]
MSNQTITKKVCNVCHQEKVKGITVYTAFICSDCEQDMIHTEPGDEKYQYYVEKLKVINQLNQFS